MDEKEKFRSRNLIKNIFSIIELFDPLGIVEIIKDIRNERFFLEQEPDLDELIRPYVRSPSPASKPKFHLLKSNFRPPKSPFNLPKPIVSPKERLRQFIDSYVKFFDFDYFSEKFLYYIQNIFNNILAKTYQIEVDIVKIKNIIFELYPIRRLIEEHRKVLDILSKY